MPKRTPNASFPDELRFFIFKAVGDVAPHVAYDPPMLANALHGLVLWSFQSAGLPLERDVVFDRDIIVRYIEVGCDHLADAVRAGRRSVLLRCSELLLSPGLRVRRLPSLPPSDPTAPYSARELVSLQTWASGQSTPSRRKNALVLLGLGLGAGLSAQEIIDLVVEQILVTPDGMDINVSGPRARVVPVLREWEEVLVEQAATMKPGTFAFAEGRNMSAKNVISGFVGRSTTIATRPQSQRMRTTWLVHHLNAGTHPKVLMQAAGIESLEALTRYMRFVDDVPAEKARSLLREA